MAEWIEALAALEKTVNSRIDGIHRRVNTVSDHTEKEILSLRGEITPLTAAVRSMETTVNNLASDFGGKLTDLLTMRSEYYKSKADEDIDERARLKSDTDRRILEESNDRAIKRQRDDEEYLEQKKKRKRDRVLYVLAIIGGSIGVIGFTAGAVWWFYTHGSLRP